MGVEIEKVFKMLKLKFLKGDRKISICVDIWPKPGMTAFSLGKAAHNFSSCDNKRHNIKLAVHHLPLPHTAETS